MGTERWWNILAAEYWLLKDRPAHMTQRTCHLCLQHAPRRLSCYWTQVPLVSSWHLTAWGMLHLTPIMTVSHLNTIFKTTTFSPGCTSSVSENACYQHTWHYLLCTTCPRNTHSRMQRPKSSSRHNTVNTNELWQLQFLISVLPLHHHV